MQNAFIWRILHVYSLVLIIFQYWPISLQQAFSRIFLAPKILSIMENCEEGHQTFTYACIALLLKVKRDFFRFLSFKDQKDFAQCVATKLTPQRFHASQSFCWRCLQRAMFSFFLFYLFIYMYFAWLGARSCGFRVQFCTVCEPCSLVIHLVLHSSGMQTVSLQSHVLIQIILSFGCRKVHFSLNDLPFSTDSVLLSKKCQRYGKGICPSR